MSDKLERRNLHGTLGPSEMFAAVEADPRVRLVITDSTDNPMYVVISPALHDLMKRVFGQIFEEESALSREEQMQLAFERMKHGNGA